MHPKVTEYVKMIQEETDKVFSTKVPWLEGIIGRKKEPLQTAGILLDHSNGLILAVWGGNDVTSISFNRATQARRQAGSSFKPLVYALAGSTGLPLLYQTAQTHAHTQTEPFRKAVGGVQAP